MPDDPDSGRPEKVAPSPPSIRKPKQFLAPGRVCDYNIILCVQGYREMQHLLKECSEVFQITDAHLKILMLHLLLPGGVSTENAFATDFEPTAIA